MPITDIVLKPAFRVFFKRKCWEGEEFTVGLFIGWFSP